MLISSANRSAPGLSVAPHITQTSSPWSSARGVLRLLRPWTLSSDSAGVVTCGHLFAANGGSYHTLVFLFFLFAGGLHRQIVSYGAFLSWLKITPYCMELLIQTIFTEESQASPHFRVFFLHRCTNLCYFKIALRYLSKGFYFIRCIIAEICFS
jgi:hypothetical protein